ncbi:alpha/beta hydrolase [Candidatus Enterococcus clewellii]|uniref:Peptidase S9 prolyl oligopeptidase catalytic domain-containing protein n=1 Tax=Candidatus Enterococcus clewellii TaxID=1834193 RepID=A0AAQ3Y003_9ENTE
MKKKLFITASSLMILGSLAGAISAKAEEKIQQEVGGGIYLVEKEATNFSTYVGEQTNQASAWQKQLKGLTEAERQEISGYLEKYVEKFASKASLGRGIMDTILDRIVIELAFDFGFRRDDTLYSMVVGSNATVPEESLAPFVSWFNSLTNTSERYQTVYEAATKQNITLYSRYIDNGSAQTVVVHNGYRAGQNSMLAHAKMFSDMGYNVLIPDIRAHNNSEGAYITFGHYEKEDLNGWIDQEVQTKPGQEIILAGVSMGAATTILSQETAHPNVIAYIADCGYSSVEQQFKDTLGLLAQYLESSSTFKDYDWKGREETLIHKLNEEKTKPLLGMDIYSVSPLEAVDDTGVPKLFIHGDADTFIPPVAQDLLYDKAIGYKEKLTILGAEHGVSLATEPELYIQTITSFLATIGKLETKHPEIAADVNLLKNPTFISTNTHLKEWAISVDNQQFSTAPLNKNELGEFILKKELDIDVVKAFQVGEALRIYSKNYNNFGVIGQMIPARAGETYELTFSALNDTYSLVTYPNVVYRLGDTTKDEALKGTKKQSRRLTYQAQKDGDMNVSLGAKLGYKIFFSKDYALTILSEPRVVNVDRTPPVAVTITNILETDEGCMVQGTGEQNTEIIIENTAGTLLTRTSTDAQGAFQINIAKGQEKLVHLINKDYKGNKSESRIIVFQ